MRKLAEENASSPMDDNFASLKEARWLLSLHVYNLAHMECSHKAKSLFAQGDKNGKLLAMLVANQKMHTNIPAIRNNQGEQDLNQTFF